MGNRYKTKKKVVDGLREDDFTFAGDVDVEVSEPETENPTITSEEYNRSLFTPEAIVDGIELPGNYVLLRLFRLLNKTKSGFIVPNIEMVPSESGERMIPKFTDFNFAPRGVVVKVGAGCSDWFNDKVSVGTVVDLKHTDRLHEFNYSFSISADTAFENYYMMPESMVKTIWKDGEAALQ